MARTARTRPARRALRLGFPAIEVTGGLLTPDTITRIAEPGADAETRRGYGVPEGLDLRDEIARAFRIAQALWEKFDAGHAADPSAALRVMPDMLRLVFGFDDLETVPPTRLGEGETARTFPIGHAAGAGRVPVVIAPAVDPGRQRTGLDVPHEAFADDTRRRSATQLLQEYLNAEDTCLWGLATDGRTLRLLRDNLSLTRPAWIESDLAKILRDGLYADFSALWLLIHRGRFGAAGAAPSDSALEQARERGRRDGVTAREKLREGVEHALRLLGQGALTHPANTALRGALSTGRLTPQGLFEELLGTVYRLIFLFAAEDRDLLHPADTPAEARRAYAAGYGVGRLRERAIHRTAWTRHPDAWDGLRALFRALAHGAPAIGVPGLGGLFDPGRTPHMDGVRIDNRAVMEAIYRLAWIRPPGQSLARVNWRDMETEELGSVYEGLLELIPRVNVEARTFAFAETTGAAGSDRKSTGSYYTPDALVRLVLDSALDPLLDRADLAPDPVEAMLSLTVLDPACGSGHFLLGAARRMAARIAALRSPGAPGRDDFQHALREVVSRCLYGVDRNPLAVELCKVALWIEALEPGKPLSYLAPRIVCGDSLVGVQDLAVLMDGIPDAAYDALTGDDRDAARLYRRWNTEQRDGKVTKGGLLADLRPPASLIDEARATAAMPDDSLAAVAAKARAFDRLTHGEGWLRRKQACDLYMAAFLAPKPPLADDAPTVAERDRRALAMPVVPLTGHVWAAARGEPVYGPLLGKADTLAHAARALHWPIAFPVEMAQGGFDVVIGNPPWERIKLQEQEFFRGRAPDIAAAPNQAARRRMIDALATAPEGSAEHALFEAFQYAKREAEAASTFARSDARYPLTGVGDVNTYALFAEAFATLTRDQGRAGVLVPTGIATDSTTAPFFGWLVDRRAIARLFSFHEIRRWFPGTDDRNPFCILVIATNSRSSEFAFGISAVAQLGDDRRRFTLTPEQIARINPNTRTAPIFRTRADAELTARVYDRLPVLIRERPDEEGGGEDNPWGLVFQRMFDMSTDSRLFRPAEMLTEAGWQRDGADWVSADGAERMVPLYEAKMIHHFDHRWATYGTGEADDEGARNVTLDEKADPAFEPEPRYWVPAGEVRLRAARASAALKGALRKGSAPRVLKALAEHVAAAWPEVHGAPARGDDLLRILGRRQPWTEALGASPDKWLVKPKTRAALPEIQRRTPLDGEDLRALADAPGDAIDLAEMLIDRKQPRWLMGWRDICRATDERTVIFSVMPKVGTGDKVLLAHHTLNPGMACTFLAVLNSIPLDFIARQKYGGTSLKYHYMKQFAVLPPSAFSSADLDFIVPRVLELTYTSHVMKPWAEDLGHTGAPFGWDPDRRAHLRADLDGFMARKVGLTRDELRYVLDPADVHGPDFPSETFRVLRDREIARLGEYRTGRLVLAAYDALPGAS